MRTSINSKKISTANKSAKSVSMNGNPLFGFDLFDALPDMYFLLDAKGEILKLNKNADEIIKANLKSYPTNFLDLVDLCNREGVNNVFFQCISFGKTTDIETQFLLAKKEIEVRISFSIYKLNLDGNKIEYIFAFAKDITEQKVKEIELQKFFNIAESSLNPILITDLN